MKIKLAKLRMFSRTIAGKTVIFGVIAALILANFGPIMRVFAQAPTPPEDYAMLQINGVNSLQGEDNSNELMAYFENGSLSVSGSGLYSNNNLVYAPVGSSVTLDANGEGDYQGRITIDGDQKNGSTFTLNNLPYNQGPKIVNVEFFIQGDDPGPIPQGNTEATIKLRPGEGSYEEPIYDQNHDVVDYRTVYYSETYTEAQFSINNGMPYQMSPEDAKDGYSQATYSFDSENEDSTVDITLITLWHLRYVDKVIINNTEYPVSDYINYDNQASYLSHYNGQVVSFTIEGVPKSDTYDITAKVEKSEHTWIGNFLWTADPTQEWVIKIDEETGERMKDEDGNYVYEEDEDGNRKPSPNYIGHSTIQPVAVSYVLEDITYSCNIDEDTCSRINNNDPEDPENRVCSLSQDEDCGIDYVEYGTDDTVAYDDGSLVTPAGSRVTMRIIPDYGYQIMNVNMAEYGLEVSDDGVGEFTFTVPEGAAYFVADVVKTDDTVQTSTEKVTDGSIDLGEGQTTMEHGSAQLRVNDVELSDENLAAFEDAAGDYAIKNYLDISLYNIVCKGDATCEGTDEDSWSERVHELNEPATITLQLDEGVDGNEIVIVHEVSEGVYEVIPAEYDPETHTITFTTTSFSNYAIASRTVNSPETGAFSAVKTGVAASIYGVVVTLTVVAIIAVLCYNRRHDSE